MKGLLAGIIVLHGLVHLMGPVKAFGLAELPQLAAPISRTEGVAWLVAALSLFLAAGLLVRGQPTWWIAALAGVLVSQAVIATAWDDAKFGTILNVIVLAAALYGLASEGPFSLRNEYRQSTGARLADAPPSPRIGDADLARLPEPVQRYVRLSGALGRPHVRGFRASFRGRIRAGPEDPWMEFQAEQRSLLDEPARFFLMSAKRAGLPIEVLHVFEGGAATMRVRLLSVIPVADAHGPELTQSETVTLFNDLCVLAPAALVDADVRWEPLDALSVRGTYTLGPHAVTAVLHFNGAGELVDFVSDDRMAASADGTTFTSRRWSTPLFDYRDFDGGRVMGRGEGRWHASEGEFTYIELELLELDTEG